MVENPGLLEIADELYGLGLPEFTPSRDVRAKDLKRDDKDLSAQVKALRKPSLAAWVVNALVRHEAEQVEQVLAVGAALREAQANLDGDELRALTRQRRQLTAAVTTRARGLASELGVKVTSAVSDQVEATLTAAMVDEECARAVRSGLLVAALTSTGIEASDIAGAVALPDALGFAATARTTGTPGTPDEPTRRPDLHVVPDPEAEAKALAAARAVVDDAEAELTAATAARDAAATEVEELEARSMQLQAEIDELRRRLAELESSAEEVDDELADAEDVRAEAEDAVTLATTQRDAAATALGRLRD